MPCPEPDRDLRALDYVSEFETHLMCPICHIPFINPVVLECDHCFCARCFVQSCDRAIDEDEGLKCPSCRTSIAAMPKKAPRLILNMCDDVKVRCSNHGCEEIMSRGFFVHHAVHQCKDELLRCPAFPACEKLTKRKHFMENQCRHSTHIECDCGELIQLGKGEWLKHRDEDCPDAGVRCEKCGDKIPAGILFSDTPHRCDTPRQLCPGAGFGCSDFVNPGDMDEHVEQCIFGRLAPSLKAQASLLTELQEELAQTKMRNEILEATCDKMSELLREQLLPLVRQGRPSELSDMRPHSSGSQTDLTGLMYYQGIDAGSNLGGEPRSPPRQQLSPVPTSQQHLLALHESLQTSFTSLESDFNQMSNNLAELDARTSMHIMNETLRIKEDLAQTNAALFSTRAQVQWLLNRERVGQQMGLRGRALASSSTSDSHSTAAMSGTAMARTTSSEGSGGEQATEASIANRPVRRPSGGSQERVKL